jgi:hypothetical protein
MPDVDALWCLGKHGCMSARACDEADKCLATEAKPRGKPLPEKTPSADQPKPHTQGG